MKKTINQEQLLRMANDAKQTAQLFNEYGFWRFARDSQKQVHVLNKMAKRVEK